MGGGGRRRREDEATELGRWTGCDDDPDPTDIVLSSDDASVPLVLDADKLWYGTEESESDESRDGVKLSVMVIRFTASGLSGRSISGEPR
jgi:hypothetical protein